MCNMRQLCQSLNEPAHILEIAGTDEDSTQVFLISI